MLFYFRFYFVSKLICVGLAMQLTEVLFMSSLYCSYFCLFDDSTILMKNPRRENHQHAKRRAWIDHDSFFFLKQYGCVTGTHEDNSKNRG
jgi:hypothetical protein